MFDTQEDLISEKNQRECRQLELLKKIIKDYYSKLLGLRDVITKVEALLKELTTLSLAEQKKLFDYFNILELEYSRFVVYEKNTFSPQELKHIHSALDGIKSLADNKLKYVKSVTDIQMNK